MDRTGYQSIFGQVLEEALRMPSLHIEVEGIGGEEKREERKQSQC